MDILAMSFNVSPDALSFFDHFEQLAYLLTAILFILALAQLSHQRTAERGNLMGICGMVIALIALIVTTVARDENGAVFSIVLILVAMAIGASIGIWNAVKVKMTEMPELVDRKSVV